MPSAYVLFNVESGSEDQVLNDVRKVEHVMEAYVSYGVYDLVVKVKADTMNEVRELVSYHLRAIKNVRSTLTLMQMEE